MVFVLRVIFVLEGMRDEFLSDMCVGFIVVSVEVFLLMMMMLVVVCRML